MILIRVQRPASRRFASRGFQFEDSCSKDSNPADSYQEDSSSEDSRQEDSLNSESPSSADSRQRDSIRKDSGSADSRQGDSKFRKNSQQTIGVQKIRIRVCLQAYRTPAPNRSGLAAAPAWSETAKGYVGVFRRHQIVQRVLRAFLVLAVSTAPAQPALRDLCVPKDWSFEENSPARP